MIHLRTPIRTLHLFLCLETQDDGNCATAEPIITLPVFWKIMFFNIINEQIPKPSCFHTAAYEANFYWTIFGKEGSAMALESYRRALDICNKWLSYASTIRNGISFRLCYTVQELPIIISNRWSIIFDKYIQIVFGFLSFAKRITNHGFQSNYKLLNSSSDLNFIVHVYPLDLLGYIRYQCTFHLRKYSLLNGSFTYDMHKHISKMLLYAAARISTQKWMNKIYQ